jgi:hypothetical protein
VRAADIIDIDVAAAPEAYRRADDRPAPYNLYAAPDRLRRATADDAAATTPPDPLFSYREAGTPLAGPGAETVGGFHTTGAGSLATEIVWSWDARDGTWVREQDATAHADSAGVQVHAANVVVRITPYRDGGMRDSRGTVVPRHRCSARATPRCSAAAAHNPGAGTSRPPTPSPPTPTRRALPLRLAPGTTWVEVLPPGSGEIVRQ